jgi:hypothetical protein
MFTLAIVGYILTQVITPTLVWVVYGAAWAAWVGKTIYVVRQLMQSRED